MDQIERPEGSASSRDHIVARRSMVASQLRTTAVSDPRVVAAMGAVPRERFVSPERAGVAYVDTLIPLGGGRMLNTPMATARLINAVAPRPGDRALLIGAATGYAAAVLGRLVATLIALDEEGGPALANDALPGNVTVAVGPLAAGWAAGAPYDIVLIDGAVETVPPAIVGQLAEDGRLATGMIERGVTRLASGRKAGGGFGLLAFADAEVAILPGFERPKVFTF